MIEINLLPGAGKKKQARGQAIDFSAMAASMSGRMRDKFMIASVVGVVIALGAVGFMYISQNTKEESLTTRREAAVRDSTRYANFLKDRYKSEAIRDTLLRQVNLIKNLDEDRYVWPHIMDEVSRALPQYTWLTSLGLVGPQQGAANVVISPKTPVDTSKRKAPKRLDTAVPRDSIQVRVQGRTVDIQALTKYMRDLEASPFLYNVTLEKSEPAVDNGKEVTQFQLTLTYSRPDTTILHRVPLTLSVK
ncbi:MAG TPA: PilN domain-containing protein [Gemmatimonadaceae bacterium]